MLCHSTVPYKLMGRMDQRLVGELPKVSKNSCIMIRKGGLPIDGRDTVTGQTDVEDCFAESVGRVLLRLMSKYSRLTWYMSKT